MNVIFFKYRFVLTSELIIGLKRTYKKKPVDFYKRNYAVDKLQHDLVMNNKLFKSVEEYNYHKRFRNSTMNICALGGVVAIPKESGLTNEIITRLLGNNKLFKLERDLRFSVSSPLVDIKDLSFTYLFEYEYYIRKQLSSDGGIGGGFAKILEMHSLFPQCGSFLRPLKPLLITTAPYRFNPAIYFFCMTFIEYIELKKSLLKKDFKRYKLIKKKDHWYVRRGLRSLRKKAYYLRLKGMFFSKMLSELVKQQLVEKTEVNSNVHYFTSRGVGARLITKYVASKLNMDYSIMQLIQIIFYSFYRRMKFRGALMKALGRFNRLERAVVKIRKRGKLYRTSPNRMVDYAFLGGVLKYSAFGLRVYIARKLPYISDIWDIGSR